MWTLNSVVRSAVVCLLASVVVLAVAGPAWAVPTIEFTDRPGDHPLVVTHEIPTLEELPPVILALYALLGTGVPESHPEIETSIGQADLMAILLNPVGVEGMYYAKVVDGVGTTRGLLGVQIYGPALQTVFVSDSGGGFDSLQWHVEHNIGSVPTTVADGTMQEVLTFPGLTISVRFPTDEPISVPVPGSVLLVGCGLLVLRRGRRTTL